MRFIIVLLILTIPFAVAEEIFQIPLTGDLQLQAVTNYDARTNYYLGPQAMGVDGNENIYILDNLNKRILVYNIAGKFLKKIVYNAQGCGLAVAPDGSIAIFSPSLKSITWIKGNLAGKTIKIENFAAISQVWFQNGTWWARCGNKIKSLFQNTVQANVFAFNVRELVFGKLSGEAVALDAQKTIVNAYPVSTFGTRNEMAIVLKTVNSKGKGKKEILLCDLQMGSSKRIELKRSFSKTFSTYTVADNYVYQMVITPTAIAIHKDALTPSATNNLKVSNYSPQPSKEFKTSIAPTYIKVWFRKENEIRTVKLQDYLKGVVSAEIYASWRLEAHRAMAVAARTYALGRKRHTDADICTSTHCQAWTANIVPNARQGVDDTNGVMIYHNGSRIRSATYFAHCNGKTRNSEEKWNYVPYLRSVSCGCGHTKYYGHGIGACQWGLQTYALKGWSYSQIIKKYYTGTEVRK